MAAGVLLDTHVLHWWWCSPALLSQSVRRRLKNGDQEVVVSAISWLEPCLALEKAVPRTAQLQSDVAELLRRFPESLADDGFRFLPLQISHVQRAARLRGPTDGLPGWINRVLVAQAQQEGLQLVSLDPTLEVLGEPLVW